MFKVIIKTPEQRQWHPGAFIVNFEHISQLFSNLSIVDFEQVNVSWEVFSDIFRTLSNIHDRGFLRK